ncbi:MAG: hypothetical protein N3D16_10920 [Anaerolineales bacterium]|nr:hypothetical protein [Anaerolineales bacterium]
MKVQVSEIETLPITSYMPFVVDKGETQGNFPNRVHDPDLSELGRLVLKQGWSEAQFTAQSTKLVFRRDGSLALSVQTHTSFSFRRQEITLEVYLPASILGEGFTMQSPLVIEIEAWDEHLHLQFSRQITLIRPTRRVEEILFDILNAVQEAFGRRDIKSLRLFFDEEALKIIAADEKLRKLVGELLSLIQMIQALRQKEPLGDTLTVSISGKGRPYWQVNDERSVEIEETTISLRFVFQPGDSDLRAGRPEVPSHTV